MTGTSDASEGPDWPRMVAILRDRAKRYALTAGFDMAVIAVTLLFTSAAFLGAEKLADYVFTSPSERKAQVELTNAKSELTSALASLAEPASDIIRNLPTEMRPQIENWLEGLITGMIGQYLPTGNEVPDEADTTADTPLAEDDEPVVVMPMDLPPPVIEPIPEIDLEPPVVEPNADDVPRQTELYEMLLLEMRRNLDLMLELQAEREAYALNVYTYDSDYQIAELQSADQVEIARIQADAETSVAYEQTQQLEERNAVVASTMTRIGAVVMAIWLTKIFVVKRQTSVRLAAFYTAVADAIELSDKSNPRWIAETLPVLMPSDLPTTQADQGEMDLIARIVGALGPRGG